MIITSSRRTKRHRRALVALAVAFLIVSIASGSMLAYRSVQSQATQLEAQVVMHLEHGQAELEAAKTSLRQANGNLDTKQIDLAKMHFATAKADFLAAIRTADSSELLRRIESLPSYGPKARSQHTAVDDVAQMGVQIALAGQDLADLEGQLIKPPAGGQGSRTLLTVINQVQSKIGSVKAELNLALKAANKVDVSVLPADQRTTFLRARGTIGLAVGAIDQFEGLVPILVEALGGNGPRTYLIEQLNPAELRPGGGFIGTYSVLRANHGTLTLIKSGDAGTLTVPRPSIGEPGYVTAPGAIRELLTGDVSWIFTDSNFFPDFPTNAQYGERFAQPRLGIHLDGVIAIDYYTVARMLQLTGPVAVPGYGLTLTSNNLVPLIIRYDLAAYTDPHADIVHKAILAAVAGPLLQKVATLQPGYWPALLGALNDLASSRHLQAFFNNGDLEKTMVQYGWSGVQEVSTAKDFMMEVESNLGATKANYYVTRHYTIELTRNGATLHHKMTVDITDDMPYEYRPNEFYRAYIRLYVSGDTGARSDNLARLRYSNPPPPAGTRVLDGWLQMHGYGHDMIVVFQWDTPWQPNGRDEQQIYWQKQPGTTADKLDVIWHDGNGHTYKVSGDLSQDRLITLTTRGVTLQDGQTGSATLPSLSLG
jgi:uncharacterized protein DUF4012